MQRSGMCYLWNSKEVITKGLDVHESDICNSSCACGSCLNHPHVSRTQAGWAHSIFSVNTLRNGEECSTHAGTVAQFLLPSLDLARIRRQNQIESMPIGSVQPRGKGTVGKSHISSQEGILKVEGTGRRYWARPLEWDMKLELTGSSVR
jgi:hypothetical protein